MLSIIIVYSPPLLPMLLKHLLWGHTSGSPTQFTFGTHLAGNELDWGDGVWHISCLRSLRGDPGECCWFVLICDSNMVANGGQISISQILIDLISSGLLRICPSCNIDAFFLHRRPTELTQQSPPPHHPPKKHHWTYRCCNSCNLLSSLRVTLCEMGVIKSSCNLCDYFFFSLSLHADIQLRHPRL